MVTALQVWPVNEGETTHLAPQTCKPFGDFNPNDQEQYESIMHMVHKRCRSEPIGASNLSNALKLAGLCFEMDSSTGESVTDRLIVLSDLDVNAGELADHVELNTEATEDLQTELLRTTEDGVPWVERVRRGATGGIHGDTNSKLWYTTVESSWI